MAKFGLSQSIRRVEDPRLLKGDGRYTADIELPGQTQAYVLRSPHAHAKILSLDTAVAKAMPGVLAVITGADLVAMGVGEVPCVIPLKNADGSPRGDTPRLPLATDTVRHVGDPVVFVVAESTEQARDAAEAVMIDYAVLPSATDLATAHEPGAPAVWPGVANNTVFDWEAGDRAATDALFGKAAHVTRLTVVNNRVVVASMEGRACTAEYDAAQEKFTLYAGTQGSWLVKNLLAANVLKVAPEKVRVVTPDVGGGFGMKLYLYAEYAMCAIATRQIGRPVRWAAERTEAFLSDTHGRDNITLGELALDAEGKFLALRTKNYANMGAYLSTFAPFIPTGAGTKVLASIYGFQGIHAHVLGVLTNTVPVDAYRGAGRPEATFLIERLVDVAARETGIDKIEIRRKNFIRPDQFPYQTPVALEYDSGDYFSTLDMAMKASDWAGFEARRAEAARHGKLRGIGISTYLEACGIAPSAVVGALGARAGLYEVGVIRVHPTGSVTVLTGTHSHGQGHETTLAQLVSDRLGVPVANVDIVHGDTAKVPFGMGTYGSRSLAVGGSAMVKAMDKIVAKAKRIAAHLMEADVADIEFDRGTFRVAGTDKTKSLTDISLAAYVPHNYPIEEIEPGLEETAFYDPKNFTYPGGCHICEVEIEPETGAISVVNFTAVDDVGRVINPMIVEGQVQGGVAQGIGQALLEACVYDPQGQLVSGSMMDYTMPRADDLAPVSVATHTTLCTHNPLGVKGCGEVGAIGSPPAVINAVVDALRDYGVRHVEMPATPAKIWSIIHSNAPRMAAE